MPPALIERDIDRALQRRPEVAQLRNTIERGMNKMRLQENALLPRFDVRLEAGQGLGSIDQGGSSRDSTDTTLGLSFSVPIQRRAARARLEQARNKLDAMRLEQQQLEEKIALELQDILLSLRYAEQLAQLAEQLMAAMAVALDLPADYFESMLTNPISSMRALHYPAIDDLASAHGSLRAGAHSDYGTLTILRTDGVEGLEIQAADQSWVAVEPQPDTFVVNLGDSIAQWTNDRWRSTVHRVAMTDTAPRQSFAFFHMANWDATIECLPTCRTEGVEPRHAPAQAGPWLMRKFQATVT
jgi:isopenicillin N synthase-like dioxygenase